MITIDCTIAISEAEGQMEKIWLSLLIYQIFRDENSWSLNNRGAHRTILSNCNEVPSLSMSKSNGFYHALLL